MADQPLNQTFSIEDHTWMQRALELADEAARNGEVPVGALVVSDGVVIGEGFNRNIAQNDPTAHAEILAIRAACNATSNYRLPGSRLFVTLEPCAMCVGAIIHCRVSEVIFAAGDPKTGALGGAFRLAANAASPMPAAAGVPMHNHSFAYRGGLLGEESSMRLRAFFQDRRAKL